MIGSRELTGANVFSVKPSEGIFEVGLLAERLILTNPQQSEYRDQFVVKWGHHVREVSDLNLQMCMLDAYLNLWSLQSCALKNVFH